jgi:two-component system OmpR family sensor kinase
MTTLSLRARLTLWYTLALVVVLGLFGADVLWIQRRIGGGRVDRELDSLTTTLANIVRAELSEHEPPPAAAAEATRTLTAPGRAIAMFDAQGVPLAASWNGLEPRHLRLSARPDQIVWTEQTPSDAWRIHVRSEAFDGTTLFLLAANRLADVQREQSEVQEAMLVGIPIALLLAGGGGFWLASVGLRPIARMAQQAERISLTGAEDLGRADRTDELGQFARAFNSLVHRLRAALQTERQFMADASHELRTPVSVVRTVADVTLSRDHRSEGEYREALTIVGEQSRRLGRLVEDMLVLARADAGGYPLRPVDLYLEEVVTDCRRAVDVLAAERGVIIQSVPSPETPFRGDEDLLRRLVLNVLQNAVQHTPCGGSVSVEMSQDSDAVKIRIADTGVGIPSADQTRIFDRFVQLDPARRGRGAGLGLPIARWIAEAHGGTVVLESSSPNGTIFCVTLPHFRG